MTTVRAYEPGRLMRASLLPIVREGPTQFSVKGQEEEWYKVDLSVDPPCYCLDFQHRGSATNPCKHVLAARLQNGDPALVPALGEMLLRAQKHIKALTRRSSRAIDRQEKQTR